VSVPDGSVLQARHPTSHQGNLTDRPAQDLDVGLNALRREVLTDQRLETSLPAPETDRVPLAMLRNGCRSSWLMRCRRVSNRDLPG
jgi:hypothetical protein